LPASSQTQLGSGSSLDEKSLASHAGAAPVHERGAAVLTKRGDDLPVPAQRPPRTVHLTMLIAAVVLVAAICIHLFQRK
jgi:hypothetical protein